MRNLILYLGVIILVIGGSLVLVSLNANPYNNNFRFQSPQGHAIQNSSLHEIAVPCNETGNFTTVISFTINESAAKESALVPSADLGNLTRSNFLNYTIVKPDASHNLQVVFYNVPPGNYTFVNSRSSPINFDVVSQAKLDLASTSGTIGLFASAAGVIIIAGGFVAMVHRNRRK